MHIVAIYNTEAEKTACVGLGDNHAPLPESMSEEQPPVQAKGWPRCRKSWCRPSISAEDLGLVTATEAVAPMNLRRVREAPDYPAIIKSLARCSASAGQRCMT